MEPKPLNSGMCLVGDGGPGCDLSLSILAADIPVGRVSGGVLPKRKALVGDGEAGSLFVGSVFSGDMERDLSVGWVVAVSSSACFDDFRGLCDSTNQLAAPPALPDFFSLLPRVS